MGKPAGVQIMRWFGILVGLLILVSLTALAGSVIVSRSIRVVSDEAGPMAAATGAISQEILSAQNALFRYLSELSDDTAQAVEHIESLTQHLQEVRALGVDSAIDTSLSEIEDISKRYRKVLELLPGTVEGARDWSRLQEYSSAAVELGKEAEARVAALTATAQEQIRSRNRDAAKVAEAAMWVSVGVLGISLLVVLALRHWWKRFQDVILGM